MIEHCADHQDMIKHTGLIPSLRDSIVKIEHALCGDVENPGWMTKQELRVNALERQMAVVMRVMWWLAGTVGVTLVGAGLALILKGAP